MPRRRLKYYAKGPEAEEAVILAKKVFNLKEQLGINYEQMARETDLTVSSLRNIKSIWVNGARNPQYMYPSVANRLVEFWNSHLINSKSKPAKVKKGESRIKSGKAEKAVDQSEFNESVLCVLIKKVGLSQAQKVLKVRGKEDKLKDFLESLSSEKLADLV